MGWIVLTFLAGVVVIVSLLVAHGARTTATETGKATETALIATGVAGVAGVLWVIVSLALSVHTVGQRQVGIIYNFSGTIAGKKDPGVVLTMPWQRVKRENVGLQREDFSLNTDNAAVSKDQQPIYASLTLNYQVEPAKVVDLFKKVGPQWKETLMDSRVLQDFKEITSTFTAAEITTARPQLRELTRRRLAAELSQYDINVVDFFVKNIGYSAGYRESIQQKNIQVQKAFQAQAKVAQVKAEADQEVAQAEGDRRAQIARAEGAAKANRLISGSITDKLIAMKRAEALEKGNVIYVPMNWTAFGNLGTSK